MLTTSKTQTVPQHEAIRAILDQQKAECHEYQMRLTV
jgi:hypothetical protein